MLARFSLYSSLSRFTFDFQGFMATMLVGRAKDDDEKKRGQKGVRPY
jgi:hypothetical protein